DVAADGDDGFAVAAMREDAAIARAERRRLRARRGVRRLDETGAQPFAPLPRLPAAPLPGALVVAGTHARPAREMAGRRKHRHVGEQLTLTVEHRAAASITGITLALAGDGDGLALCVTARRTDPDATSPLPSAETASRGPSPRRPRRSP